MHFNYITPFSAKTPKCYYLQSDVRQARLPGSHGGTKDNHLVEKASRWDIFCFMPRLFVLNLATREMEMPLSASRRKSPQGNPPRPGSIMDL